MEAIKELKELVTIYKEMRNAQVAYFNTIKNNRINKHQYINPSARLVASKELESKCDAKVKSIIALVNV